MADDNTDEQGQEQPPPPPLQSYVQPGYIDEQGRSLGPQYDEKGNVLPAPTGAVGVRGTPQPGDVNVSTGLVTTAQGNRVLAPSDYVVEAGRVAPGTVTAAARLAPAEDTYTTTFGPTGQPQAAPTAAAIDLNHVNHVNNQYSQQQSALQDQITQVQAKLGMVPPSAAGYAAIVLASDQPGRKGEPSQAAQLHQQLKFLQGQQNALTRDQRNFNLDATRTAHQNLVDAGHTQATQDLQSLFNRLDQIQSSGLQPGTPEYARAITQARQQFAAGANTVAGRQVLTQMAAAHTREQAFQDRQYYQTFREGTVLNRQYGVPMMYDRQGNVDVAAMKQAATAAPAAAQAQAAKELKAGYGLTPEQFLNPVRERQGKYDETTGAFTNAYPEAATGPIHEIISGRPGSEKKPVYMPAPAHEAFRQALSGTQPAAAPAAQPAVAPAVPQPATAPMLRVQIPGQPVGQIPASARDKFIADHPNAQFLQ